MWVRNPELGTELHVDRTHLLGQLPPKGPIRVLPRADTSPGREPQPRPVLGPAEEQEDTVVSGEQHHSDRVALLDVLARCGHLGLQKGGGAGL